MNDSLRTNAFVRFQVETIACACIFLAARALQVTTQQLLLFQSPQAGLRGTDVIAAATLPEQDCSDAEPCMRFLPM